MQYRLIESFSNSTDPLFPLPATDNQIPVTRIPGKFEKDEKLRGTIPEFSEASENAKKEKVIPSWLKCTSRGKKITEEIGSIEKWGKIGLKFSDIIPDRRNKNSKLFIQYFREIKFHLEKGRLEKGLRTIHHDSSISYLILSYLRSKETRDSANWTEDRSNRHEIRQRKFSFEAYGGFSPGTDIFTFILRPYRAALSHKHFLYRVRSNRGSKWYRFTENSRRRGHSFPL